jgi:outer membrane protein assembly factor BamB
MRHFWAISLAFLCWVAAAQADNWPQFRGPLGQGRSAESGLPWKWSSTENVAWKAPVPGDSWSSPIVWEDCVFLTTATDEGQSCRVLAFNRADGNLLWDREVFRQSLLRKEQRNTYATPTPATDGQRVYACFGEGGFAAVDFSGQVVWTNLDYKFYSQHGLASSPIVYRDLVIMARDGSSDGPDKTLGWQKPWDRSYLVALDARSGQQRWRAQRGMSRISHGTPTIWQQGDQHQLVSEAGDVLQGFNLETGERLWSHEVLGEGKVPSTTLGDGLAFTSGGWGGKESIKAFRLGGQGSLGESQLVWEQRQGMPKVPSLVYAAPHLFAVTDGGVATCLDAASGQVRWQRRIGEQFSASPVWADGRVYFTDDAGTTTVVEAGGEYRELAKNRLGERIQASLAAAQGQLFLRTAGHLYCIDAP